MVLILALNDFQKKEKRRCRPYVKYWFTTNLFEFRMKKLYRSINHIYIIKKMKFVLRNISIYLVKQKQIQLENHGSCIKSARKLEY